MYLSPSGNFLMVSSNFKQLFLGETCYVGLGTLQPVLTCRLTYRSLTLRYLGSKLLILNVSIVDFERNLLKTDLVFLS